LVSFTLSIEMKIHILDNIDPECTFDKIRLKRTLFFSSQFSRQMIKSFLFFDRCFVFINKKILYNLVHGTFPIPRYACHSNALAYVLKKFFTIKFRPIVSILLE